MKKKIIIYVILILCIILLAPISSAINLKTKNQTKNITDDNKTNLSKYIETLSVDTPPKWFNLLYTIIMLSLNIRIVTLTPLAITPTGEYWGSYDVNNYFFFAILFTLVFRFAFWYNVFHNTAERNNWDLNYT